MACVTFWDFIGGLLIVALGLLLFEFLSDFSMYLAKCFYAKKCNYDCEKCNCPDCMNHYCKKKRGK